MPGAMFYYRDECPVAIFQFLLTITIRFHKLHSITYLFINLCLNTLLKRLKQQEMNVDVVKRAAEATSKVGLKKKLKQ